MKKIILLNIIFLNLVFSQQTPAPAQDKSVLIYGGITHVGNGELINNSVIGFTNGKIDLIASTDGNWSDEILSSFSDSNNISLNFDNTLKLIDYDYNIFGKLDNSTIKVLKSFNNDIIKDKIEDLHLYSADVTI